MTSDNDKTEQAATQLFGCVLWIILIACSCGSYFLGKHVGRTELMNEMLIQQIQSGTPVIPEVKKETE